MENTADNTGSIIGWKDVTDVSGVISLFLCYIVNKHVSHNPWMYIMAGITVAVFYLFVGVSFIISGMLRLIAEHL